MAKILLAEGEMDLRWTLRYALARNKFEVAEVASGDKVLEAVRKEKPNLLILDAHMPRKPGIEILAEIQADGAFKNIPILFLTLSNEKKVMEQALARGAREVLPKTSFSVMKMIYAVRKSLESGV